MDRPGANADTDEDAADIPSDSDGGGGPDYVVSSESEDFDSSGDDCPSSPSSDESEPRKSYPAKGKQLKLTWNVEPPLPVRASSSNVLRCMYAKPMSEATKVQNPTEAFDLFFTEQMAEICLKFTNEQISEVQTGEGTSSSSCTGPVDMIEMRAFLGAIILIGIFKSGGENVEDLWRDDGTGRDILRCIMPLRRFSFIIQNLRFDELTSRESRRQNDKACLVSELYALFNEASESNLMPGANLCVDETLVPFRGRCSFRQYIPSKPARYGLKLFTLCDAQTSYHLSSKLYTGKAENGAVAVNLSTTSVLDLVDKLAVSQKKGRNMTTDNYYTSLKLAQELKARDMTLVGTIKGNRVEVPKEFLPAKSRPTGEHLFGHARGMTLISYVPKPSRAVCLLSSMHPHSTASEIDKTTKKSEIILFYNSSKGAVDTLDQLAGTYTVQRKTNRWPAVIFFHVVNVACINADIVLKISARQEVAKFSSRREFLRTLGKELASPHVLRRIELPTQRIAIKRLAFRCGFVIGGNGQDDQRTHQRDGKRRRCYLCTGDKKARDLKHPDRCCKCELGVCPKHGVVTCTECFE